MDVQELGHRVLTRRKALRLSQGELAKRGRMSRNYISLIERGIATNISSSIVSNLAAALGMTTNELWGQATDSEVVITSILRQFGIEEGLRYEVIDKLARLPRHGQEPKSIDEWRALYNALRPYVEADNSAR